jgi:hypothetical protein
VSDEEREREPASTDLEPANAAGPDDEEVDPIFSALWSRVLEAWDDDKPHQAILQHAIAKQMLPELAGRYRSLENDPEKGPRAKKKMEGIVAAATQMLFAMKSPARTKPPWQWNLAAVMAFAIVVGWLAYALFGRR